MGQLAGAINDMAGTIESNVTELKSVERLRKELVANISHDLRTPIASIAGYTETLKLRDDIEPEQRQEFLEAIYRNAQRLEKMVNDLFELSKLEAKERTINPEPTQLGELMVDVVSKYKLLAKKRGVSINTLVTGDLPLVYVDIALIDRVFQNIIDNALRHTEEGDVINLEINPGAKHVEVRITDTGEGIKEVELPHIFDRYKRGRATGEGGGLGLAIVKKILELHEAPISVASKLKEGTTFRFELPVYQGAT